VVDCSKALVNHTVKTVFQPLLLRAHTSDDNSVSICCCHFLLDVNINSIFYQES